MKKCIMVSLVLVVLSISGLSQEANKSVRFFKPNHSWALEVPFKGFSITAAMKYSETDLKITAVQEESGITMEVYFESGPVDAESEKVRLFYESRMDQLKIARKKISRWESGGLAYLVYTAEKVLTDPPGDELNANLYACKGSTWIDFRLRKSRPGAGDEKALRSLVEKTRMVGAFEPTPEENVFMGNIYCFSGFGDNCLSCLGSAYEIEKRTPSLKRELRIALNQNYADALRMRGEREKAVDVLNQALISDPGYPMYYWIKARVFGNLADDEAALTMLEAAVKNRHLLLPGEKFPDPRQDEAFRLLGLKDSFKARVTRLFFPPEEEQKNEGNTEKSAPSPR